MAEKLLHIMLLNFIEATFFFSLTKDKIAGLVSLIVQKKPLKS
jgi:hypothetical protein